MNEIERIKREIQNSENLDGLSKLKALILLDEATRALPIKEGIEVIRILENLYQEVVDQEYKDALLIVIKKYRSEIHSKSYNTIEGPRTLRDLFKSLGISTSEVEEELLDLKLVVGVDDGMGYTPRGYQDVIDVYPNHDEGSLNIWV